MRRITILASLVAIWTLVLPVIAQDGPGPISRISLWDIKDGAGGAFEEGLKKHNDFHVKQGDRQPHLTWEILSGVNSGQFYRSAPGRKWSDFDAEDAWGAADAADSAKTLTPNLAGGITAFYLTKYNVSRPSADEAPPALVSLTFFRVKLGQTAKFNHLIKKFHEAIGEANWESNYIWYQMVNGLEGPLFVLALPRENWAAFAPPEKTFNAVLEEVYGETESEELLEQWSNSTESVWSEIVRFRADLSYIPAGS